MSFLSPGLLWGLLLVGVPLAVHLIGRKRAPSFAFGAYDYLAEVVQRLARREQLRQLLLLLLRIAIVLLLVLALAGPGIRKGLVAAESADLLVIVDASQSMAFVRDGKPLLEHAKRQASDALSDNGAGLAFVVVAGAVPRPLSLQPTADRQTLRRAVEDVALADGPADVTAAVKRGLEAFGGRPVDVVVVSDMANNAFAGGAALAAANVRRLRLIDAAQRPQPLAALDNLSLLPVSVEHLADGAMRVGVGVRNFAARPLSGELRLTLDGAVKARAFVEIGPGALAEREFTLNELSVGLHQGNVTLAAEGDGYAPDNEAAVVVEVFDEPRVLLVNGDPKSVSFRDELFYIERALQVAQPALAFDAISADELPGMALGAYKAVVLANVAAPSQSVADELGAFNKRGGGLVIALGERVAFEAYNQALGAILPARLRDQWAVADPKAQDAALSALGLIDVAWTHPVFRRFEQASEAAFSGSRTYRHFFVEASDLAKAKSLAEFSSGAPALIERQARAGEGRVVLWLSTLDRDWSDVAIRPMFAPLMAQLVRYVGGSLRSAEERAVATRAPSEIVLPAGMDEVWLRPLGESGDDPVQLKGQTAQHRFTKPGVYALATTQRGAALAGTAMAVSEGLDESDYAPIQPDELGKRWGAATDTVSLDDRAARAGGGDFQGYAHLMLLALVFVFGAQAALASRG